ncbi:hypothetical protein R3P38DRAFT_602085 [Favolaschia claudopus]|uniref:Uncharacterized protein n=1 Tax=Favolaschia claudopus TaxID=2862362 RepID=A0AAW0CAN5_9AGAR
MGMVTNVHTPPPANPASPFVSLLRLLLLSVFLLPIQMQQTHAPPAPTTRSTLHCRLHELPNRPNPLAPRAAIEKLARSGGGNIDIKEKGGEG